MMASRRRPEGEPAETDEQPPKARPDAGRFHVRVDRQTKSTHATAELAHAAALDIKRRYPVVQVIVYASDERTTAIVQPTDPE